MYNVKFIYKLYNYTFITKVIKHVGANLKRSEVNQ